MKPSRILETPYHPLTADPQSPVLLPLRPRPWDDEVFSCWMVRLAALYSLKTRSLCSLLTGQDIEFNADFDVTPDPAVFRALATRTGLDPASLRREHTLAGWSGRLYPKINRGTGTPWLLPLGPLHALRPAMQFCPLCLREPKSYFRRIWRLSLFGGCPFHAVGLHHVCPECSCPTYPLKNDLRWGGGDIWRCWNCGFDLREAAPAQVAEEDFKLAGELWVALRYGTVPLTGPRKINISSYFAGLSLVCAKLLARQPRLSRWREIACEAAGIDNLPRPAARRVSTNFNGLADAPQRRAVLRTATFLLQDWPERFLTVARLGYTRTSDFANPFAAAPSWLLEPLQARLTPPRRPPVPSAGLLKASKKRKFILEHRREWSPSKLPRLIRALRAEGFYSDRTDDSIIMRSLPKTIARMRASGADYRRRLTVLVARRSPEWSRLVLLAKPYRKAHCKNGNILRRGIRLLCQDHFLTSADLGELLHRSHRVLMAFHLTPMARNGALQTRFGKNKGGSFNYPGQAYRTSPELSSELDKPLIPPRP